MRGGRDGSQGNDGKEVTMLCLSPGSHQGTTARRHLDNPIMELCVTSPTDSKGSKVVLRHESFPHHFE